MLAEIGLMIGFYICLRCWEIMTRPVANSRTKGAHIFVGICAAVTLLVAGFCTADIVMQGAGNAKKQAAAAAQLEQQAAELERQSAELKSALEALQR